MSVNRKVQGKKAIALCLLSVCFFTVMFSQAVYAETESLPVTLTVEQVFTRPAASSAANTFTYQIKADDAGSPMPAGSSGGEYTFTINGTDNVDVGAMTYDHAGVYTYEIQQVTDPEKTGYAYDKQVYTVKVYIKNSSTGLEKEIIVVQKEDGSKVDRIRFENRYAPSASDPAIMVDPPVKKTVSGSPDKDGTFTFKLEAGNRSNPMPSGSTDGVKVLTIIGPGEAEFGTWSYRSAGTYYYKISEVNSGEKGYTYDTTVYTITDHVKDIDGRLEVIRTVTNASNKQVGSCDFINKYTSTRGAGSTTGGSGISSGLNRPKTGDDSMIGFYQIMLGISGFLCLICVVYLIMAGKDRKKIKSMI